MTLAVRKFFVNSDLAGLVVALIGVAALVVSGTLTLFFWMLTAAPLDIEPREVAGMFFSFATAYAGIVLLQFWSGVGPWIFAPVFAANLFALRLIGKIRPEDRQ